MGSKRHYTPPSHPPLKKTLLKTSRALSYPVDLEKLASQGWTTLAITSSPSDPLHAAFSELFEASSQFFSLPEAERAKYRIASRGDSQVSEEGYSRVEGEKCMICLRKSSTTPTEFGLREKAQKAWRASAVVMRDVLAAIEESLSMDEGVLVRMTEEQLELPGEGERNVATLMRMFRYDRPSLPSNPPATSLSTNVTEAKSEHEMQSRVVSEPHKDLGLLTIVVGHSPGLECWDAQLRDWVSCETNEKELNATILVGQTLAKFTNNRYVAGRHRVFVHPSPSPLPAEPSTDATTSSDAPTNPLTSPSFRYSLVHALRGHLPLLVSSSSFETPITLPFSPPLQFTDRSISEIYRAISNAHWNVNISVEERRRQEREIKERCEREMAEKRSTARSRRFSRIISVFRRTPREQSSVS